MNSYFFVDCSKCHDFIIMCYNTNDIIEMEKNRLIFFSGNRSIVLVSVLMKSFSKTKYITLMHTYGICVLYINFFHFFYFFISGE